MRWQEADSTLVGGMKVGDGKNERERRMKDKEKRKEK